MYLTTKEVTCATCARLKLGVRGFHNSSAKVGLTPEKKNILDFADIISTVSKFLAKNRRDKIPQLYNCD